MGRAVVSSGDSEARLGWKTAEAERMAGWESGIGRREDWTMETDACGTGVRMDSAAEPGWAVGGQRSTRRKDDGVNDAHCTKTSGAEIYRWTWDHSTGLWVRSDVAGSDNSRQRPQTARHIRSNQNLSFPTVGKS